MLSLQYCGIVPLFVIILKGVSCEDLTAVNNEEFTLEGSNVTLSYKYSRQAVADDYFFWYRQYPGKPPEFLLMISGLHIIKQADSLKSENRFSINLSGGNQVDLQISSGAVSDSAVYYCAVNDAARKLIFGQGTKLFIQSDEEYNPSYYKVTGDDGSTACLATDFSRYNATNIVWPISNTSKNQPPVRISGDSVFNQVAIISENDTCETHDVKQDVCTDVLTPDPKVNFVTMTILGLRLLFIKTIVFNVLITLRLWISQ